MELKALMESIVFATRFFSGLYALKFDNCGYFIVGMLISFLIELIYDFASSADKYTGYYTESKQKKLKTYKCKGETKLCYGIIGETNKYTVWYEPVSDGRNAFVFRGEGCEIVAVYPEELT